MDELTRLKNAINNDITLRLQYLRILDGLMTDGEITPEMTSVAAKKLGFAISADKFADDGDTELCEDELEAVSGGADFQSNAPDGKTVGCPYNYYLTWTDYWIRNSSSSCPFGGRHEIAVTKEGRICIKCRLALDERGAMELYGADGCEIDHIKNT